MPILPAHPAGSGAAVADHGGNLGAARARFPNAVQPWIDLSTGVNPWAYPVPPLPAPVWNRLPDAETLHGLALSAARAYGAPGPDHVAMAPGSQALIQWLPRLRPPGRVAVLVPTYAEHEVCWAAAGHAVTAVTEPAALYHESWDTVVVVNPNNPDGRRLDRAGLATLAGRLAERGGWLVVDEAFADAEPPAPEASLAAETNRPGLIVLRSFGKFFGLAGLRLGFALAEPTEAGRLRDALGPWPVSGPAAVIASAAFADRRWISETHQRLGAAASRLDHLLQDHGLTVLGGTTLFRLAATDRAAELFDALGAAGILARRFDAHPTWLRFGLPGDEAAWTRLAGALS